MKSTGGIFIGLGSNLGDRYMNLIRAIEHVEAKVGKVVQKSSVYVSAPLGFKADTDFYNQVVEIDSEYEPEEILRRIKQIESLMGRAERLGKGFESRIIDLDILDYKGQVFRFENLAIPHAQMHIRSFVLEPLAEIQPDWIHPFSAQTIVELKAALGAVGKAEKLKPAND